MPKWLACLHQTPLGEGECGRANLGRSVTTPQPLRGQPPQGLAGDIPLAFRAESAHQIDDKAYGQNQANPAAAEDRTSKVKPAAAEQQKKNK